MSEEEKDDGLRDVLLTTTDHIFKISEDSEVLWYAIKVMSDHASAKGSQVSKMASSQVIEKLTKLTIDKVNASEAMECLTLFLTSDGDFTLTDAQARDLIPKIQVVFEHSNDD